MGSSRFGMHESKDKEHRPCPKGFLLEEDSKRIPYQKAMDANIPSK